MGGDGRYGGEWGNLREEEKQSNEMGERDEGGKRDLKRKDKKRTAVFTCREYV